VKEVIDAEAPIDNKMMSFGATFEGLMTSN